MANEKWKKEEVKKLFEIMGKDNVRKLLDGDVTVAFKKVYKKLFDAKGRRIPKHLHADVCDANPNFWFQQPEMKEEDYARRIRILQESLGRSVDIPVLRFLQETECLLSIIHANTRVADVTKGVWLPVIIPKMMGRDFGSAIEHYIAVVEKSYANFFPSRKFINFRKGKLAGETTFVAESRHRRLIKQAEKESVIGIYFPNPLQGFSINADREQIYELPDEFILSGLDTIIAMIMYSDVLTRDYHAPSQDLAALSSKSSEFSYGFRFYGDDLSFGRKNNLEDANGCYSGGLLFVL